MSDNTPYTIKFTEEHVDRIRRGEKAATIRYQPETVPSPNTRLDLVDENDSLFAKAFTEWTTRLPAKSVPSFQIRGHKSYRSVQDFLESMTTYWPDADLHRLSEFVIIAFEDIRVKTDHEEGPDWSPVGPPWGESGAEVITKPQ